MPPPPPHPRTKRPLPRYFFILCIARNAGRLSIGKLNGWRVNMVLPHEVTSWLPASILLVPISLFFPPSFKLQYTNWKKNGRPNQQWHHRIMSECFFFSLGWVGVGGGGGGGDRNLPPPPLPLSHPIYIYVCGCGGWRGRQGFQDSAGLAPVIIKLARIIFAARKLPA